MPNPYFKFKQFMVRHDRCAMKVGTDGVLLGAWAEVGNAGRVLDIGTGTGLIALMVAQRAPQASVRGIDIDPDAVEQARENILLSPWQERVEASCQDVRLMSAEAGEEFDVILSNPPYFREKTQCPDRLRNTARHTDGLPFEDLLSATDRLLTGNGQFSVILPSEASQTFIGLAAEKHLYLRRCTWVHTKPGIPPKRVLLALGRGIEPYAEDHLVIESAPRVYSREYIALTGPFYLSM